MKQSGKFAVSKIEQNQQETNKKIFFFCEIVNASFFFILMYITLKRQISGCVLYYVHLHYIRTNSNFSCNIYLMFNVTELWFIIFM